jgi:murein DD-endopeptidase MepM/ murein hydrolase activator NlpD
MKKWAWLLIRKSSTELKIVLITLGVLIILPAFTLVVMAASATSIVGSAIAALNPITHLVEIFDGNGTKVREVELSTVWPTAGNITDVFGSYQPWRQELGLGPHNGIDIANIEGTPITTFSVGTVIASHNINDNSCGRYVKVDHGTGVSSLYCHMSATAGLAKDTLVKPGDVLGYIGTTGTSTGNHLHFMVMVYGIPVNPRTFMVGEPEAQYAQKP